MIVRYLSLLAFLATLANSELSVQPFTENESPPRLSTNESNSKSVPMSPVASPMLQLNQKLNEISSHQHQQHSKVKKSISSLNTTSDVVESLKSLKLISSGHANKKKPVYPDIVYQNQHERLNQDISDDLTKFEGYSKLLNQLMHTIVNKDLGLTTMQQKLDKLVIEFNSVRYDTVIDSITDKILRKIDDAHSTLEITGERIQELFKQQLVSNITSSYLSCCDFFTAELIKKSHTPSSMFASEFDVKPANSFKVKAEQQDIKNGKYQFDGHFNQWINKEYACDIGDDFRRPHFFSPSGPNLTKQFQENIDSYPNIKWQYFMTFLGVHTEYPSYMPPNNYCFLHAINSEQLRLEAEYNSNERGFPKRFKAKAKKHDSLYQHRKTYNELNQLFIQRHRENLFTTALPQGKLVVIVIDRGSALTDHQLNIAKSVAKYILNSLSHRDKVAIVGLTSETQHPSSEICSSKFELAYANYETKHVYSRYIDELQRSHNSTNHYLGFKRAFEIIASNYVDVVEEFKGTPEIFIPYISRGLLASLADAKPVMELIASELKNTTYSFVINCYALIDESKPIMYETTFLREVALMNFKKFNVDSPPSNKIRSGLMVALNNTENLGFLLNGIYTVLTKPNADAYSHVYISLPHYDFISKDTHLSLSKAFFFRDRFLGVAGVDISFSDFAEDIIHYDHSPNSYAFLLEAHSGKLLYHPVFSHHSRFNYKRSKYNYDRYLQNAFTNAEHVEQAADFPLVKKMLLSLNSGSQTIQLALTAANNESYFNFWYDHHSTRKKYSTVTYHWRRVSSSSFVVVIAEYGNEQCSAHASTSCGRHQRNTFNYTGVNKNEADLFVSHRLDYLATFNHLPEIKLCKHFNQLATKETATLFLTPSAFESPYQFEGESESPDTVQKYMAYLKDSTMSMENPGLKDTIHGDVNLMATLTSMWKELLESSETSKYIVRKFIATTSGAFIVYPGALLDQSYEPKSRPWYTKAINNPGKLVFIPPYLDVGGGGYIVTMAQAVFSHSDSVWAVMAIDLTLGYFHKIIDEMVPICSGSKSSCFIMDDYGYLVVHSSFLRPLSAFMERQHITHKEPQMVNDLLNQKSIVRKFVCNSYNDRTIQRYYMFNSSLVGILTNVIHTEDASSCAKYKMVSLEGTNAFFGIVNHTCDNSTTFCPCSLTDRLCLNCHRMEQTDCECPCECPLVMDMCSGDLAEKEDKNPSCIPLMEPLREPTVPKYLFESLDSCINSDCFNKHSESECKGVLTCEWCTMDQGFKLKKPFCTNQNICFGGVFGSRNPFLQSHSYSFPEDAHRPHSQSPIGPLSTLIIVGFLVLVFSVFCYQFQSNRSFGARYANHAEHQILQQPSTDDHPRENEFPHEGNYEAVVSLVRAQVNPNFENIASPYQVNSNYRRPRVESDYGYSTMTPNEDSELNGSIYVDTPLVVNANQKKLDLLNISTSRTTGAGSVVSTDDMSTLSSPSSASSASGAASSQRLPPPPSKTPSSKIRSKQRYFDKANQQTNLSCSSSLPPLKESSLLDIAEVRLVKQQHTHIH